MHAVSRVPTMNMSAANDKPGLLGRIFGRGGGATIDREAGKAVNVTVEIKPPASQNQPSWP